MYIEQAIVFGITALIASIIPGPAMLMALTHGMNHGAARTTASALGNVSVTIFQAGLSLTGLGTVLVASETVFQVIKWGGVAYLIYVGISVLLSSELSFKRDSNSEKTVSFKKLFGQGAMVTAGNPKAVIFFTAVFPQFIREDGSYLSQGLILISLCAFSAFISFMVYAIGGQKIVNVLSNGFFRKYFKKVLGLTFIGAGIGLALSKK